MNKTWSHDTEFTGTAVANERKVIQILYIRLWYGTIQYELIAHKKVKWSVNTWCVDKNKDKSKNNNKKNKTIRLLVLKVKKCFEIFTNEKYGDQKTTYST